MERQTNFRESQGLGLAISQPISEDLKEGASSLVVAVGSGKGGVGKSNLSVNLALACVAMGKRVVILDADLGLANINILLGFVPRYTLFHLLKREKTLGEILVKTDYGVDVIPGASGISQLADLDKQHRQFLLEELEKISFYDIIIVDVGAGISSHTMEFLRASDRVVAVTTPEPTAITDVYGLIKVFSMDYGDKQSRFSLVVNRVRNEEQGVLTANKLIKVSSQFLNFYVDYLGSLREDDLIQRAVYAQTPFYHLDRRHKASEDIESIAYNLLGEARKSVRGGLRRFLAAFINRK